jgi:deoxyribodipyrimidine photo-lyase
MATALVWFRQDLRLADNPALRAASSAARHVIPVFIWSPEEEGAWPAGAASRWWLHESLLALQDMLQQRGSGLVLQRGSATETLLQLAQATGATRIYWNCRYEPAAMRVEASLRKALDARGIIGHGFHASRLVEPATIRSGSGTPYQVFTPFWRAFLEQARIDAPEASPAAIPAPAKWPTSSTLAELDVLPEGSWHRKLAAHWKPGEIGARAALKNFIAHGLTDYAAERDRPDRQGTSRLSPCLRHGELSPRQVWTAVLKAAERAGESAATARAGKFLAELVWREFATQQLVLHPLLPDRPRSPQFESLAWRDAPADFKAWTRGRTGFPMVDAGMRELWQTGWMHNRARMITASFLVKNLLVPWQEGERWFWDTLVDADLASNALNWQWVAGTSPDAAPWFRVFNPETQAEKFDPEQAYRNRYVPESATSRYIEPVTDLKTSRARALEAFAALRRKS